MFKKLFGGSEPKNAPPPPPPPKANTEEMEIEYERQINGMNVKVEEIDLKIEKTQKRLENLDSEVRRLIAAKSKQQAKTKLIEAKQLKDLIEDMEKKKTVFLDIRMRLEYAQDNLNSVGLIRDANKIMRENEKLNDELEENMVDWKEYADRQKETSNLWSEMAGNAVNKEEIDEEYAKYEAEVNQEQANKLQNQLAGVPNAQVAGGKAVQLPQKNKFESAMEDVLNI